MPVYLHFQWKAWCRWNNALRSVHLTAWAQRQGSLRHWIQTQGFSFSARDQYTSCQGLKWEMICWERGSALLSPYYLPMRGRIVKWGVSDGLEVNHPGPAPLTLLLFIVVSGESRQQRGAAGHRGQTLVLQGWSPLMHPGDGCGGCAHLSWETDTNVSKSTQNHVP